MKPDQTSVTDLEGTLTAALLAGGVRMTCQRREIIHEIAAAHDHPDAEEVFCRVRGRVPTLSRDTVYRTLAVLVQQGLVQRVNTARATRFDPDPTPHHHFVCDRCGGLEDITPDMVRVPDVPAELPGIGLVRAVQVELCGVCAECGH